MREEFFPMKVHPESANSDLFIRTTTSLRPTGPLKLNANVLGRCVVDKLLTERLAKQIHESTLAAEKAKKGRTTIMLDKPPPEASTKGRRKAIVKTVRQSVPSPLSQIVASQPQPVASSSTTNSSNLGERLLELRSRLIHFLALGPQSSADVLKHVGGANQDNETRRAIVELLSQVSIFL